jgi:hypothetical protein
VLARFLLWRLLGLLAVPLGLALATWFASGGVGTALRGGVRAPGEPGLWPSLTTSVAGWLGAAWGGLPIAGVPLLRAVVGATLASAGALVASRTVARSRRAYARLRVGVYRTDSATVDELVAMVESLHKRLLVRWWERLLRGQPSISLEVHVGGAGGRRAWLAVSCPAGLEAMVEAAIRNAYPNARLVPGGIELRRPPYVLRLKKRYEFIKRVKVLERLQYEGPPVDRLITAMAASGAASLVQIALTPTPATFDRWAKRMYKRHERRLARERERGLGRPRDRSQVGTQELSDLRLPGRAAVLESVLGNVAAIVAHRQVVPDSADLIAGIAGTRGAWSTALRSDGGRTHTRVREYAIHPDQIKSLPRGWAAVLVPGAETPVRITRVLPPDRG